MRHRWSLLLLLSLLGTIVLAGCGHTTDAARKDPLLLDLTTGARPAHGRAPDVAVPTAPLVSEQRVDRPSGPSIAGSVRATPPARSREIVLRPSDVFGRRPLLPASPAPPAPR